MSARECMHVCCLNFVQSFYLLLGRGGGGVGGGGGGEGDEPTGSDVKSTVARQHMMICASCEVSSLISSLNTASLPLVISDAGGVGGENPAPLIEALNCMLINQSIATR